MTTYLISLLSDHLIPNYLFIKEMEGKYDKLLFISTPKMTLNGKPWAMEQTLGLSKGSVPCIEASEENFEGLKQLLTEQGFSETDNYILNLTGGTKVMSVAVYDFFKDYQAEFYYIPIGKNTIRNLATTEEQQLYYRVNLKEYFSLYQLHFEANNSITEEVVSPIQLFKKYKKAKFNRHRVPEILKAHEAEPKFRFYYGGGWFEEYIYLRVKEELSIADGYIVKSAKVFRQNSNANDNEIDLMFVKDNKLSVVECKLSLNREPGANYRVSIETYLYKLAAIAKDFGLIVDSYFFTLHDIMNDKIINQEQVYKRCSILGVKKILDRNNFINSHLFL